MTSVMSVNPLRPTLSNGMTTTTMLGASGSPAQYPISSTLSIPNPGPQSFPAATGRPTLSGGFASGRISGGYLFLFLFLFLLLLYHVYT